MSPTRTPALNSIAGALPLRAGGRGGGHAARVVARRGGRARGVADARLHAAQGAPPATDRRTGVGFGGVPQHTHRRVGDGNDTVPDKTRQRNPLDETQALQRVRQLRARHDSRTGPTKKDS